MKEGLHISLTFQSPSMSAPLHLSHIREATGPYLHQHNECYLHIKYQLASLSTVAQVPERGKQPKIDEGPSGVPGIDVVDLDIISPSLESKEIIQQLKAENDLLQQKLEMANWTITYLEQRNKQLEDEHSLDELQRIHEDRNLARKRPGDLTPIEREAMLIRVNTHLEKLLAKANMEKDMLRHMKNHYWA